MIGRPTLHTSRLVLRPRDAADIDTVLAAAADPELVRWLPRWDGVTRQDVVDRVDQAESASGVDLAFTAGGEFAGECWLAALDRINGVASTGYWVAPGARGRGYAAEAMAALAAWGFANLGLERIQLNVGEHNIASQRAALRAGFRPDGRRRLACRTAEEMMDMLVFARLRDDPDGPAPRPLPDAGILTDGVVVLRPLVAADAAAWYAERTDQDCVRWSGSLEPPTWADAHRRTAGAAAEWLLGEAAAFAVIDGSGDGSGMAAGEYAGSINLRMTEPGIGVGEIGYSVAPGFRGRGLMRRALRLAGRWALTEVGLARVQAGVGVDNAASLRTAEAAGFRREGVLRQGLPGSAGRYDMVVLGLLPADLAEGLHVDRAPCRPGGDGPAEAGPDEGRMRAG